MDQLLRLEAALQALKPQLEAAVVAQVTAPSTAVWPLPHQEQPEHQRQLQGQPQPRPPEPSELEAQAPASSEPQQSAGDPLSPTSSVPDSPLRLRRKMMQLQITKPVKPVSPGAVVREDADATPELQ